MDKYVLSTDGIKIHYEVTGKGSTALIFVHGWLGNAEWWKSQQEYFEVKYSVVLIDLPGHGKSDKSRRTWSSRQYAEDIKSVTDQINSQRIILVGHSMSGAYVLEASLYIDRVEAIILVDTLKDLEKLLSFPQAEQLLFNNYKKDFKSAIENLMPQYLFAEATPEAIVKQLQSEFLKYDPELAVNITEPLYKMNIREIAKQVRVPVRSVNSDFTPTNLDNNRQYFKDYDFVTIHGTGHYPMLEQPDKFNIALEEILHGLLQ